MANPTSDATAVQGKLPLTAVIRSLYTNNPFYLVSAGLILYGLHVAFRPEPGQLINPWVLMAALCGYAVVLTATASLIIRVGKVWEDARSIVLVLLLIIVAVSVSFDEMINTSPAQGFGLMLYGLGFATAISEGLFRGLSLKLSWLFRVPYYAILVLFYVYPLFVSQEVTELPRAAVELRIYLFSFVAGAAFLCLIPAIRRGARLVQDNGTPWRWPWFPWTAFAFLALGAVLRAYGLSLSFSPADGMESTFGVYFLVPFLLAVLVLILEVGIVEGRGTLKAIAIWGAPILLLLSIPVAGGSDPYHDFLTRLVDAGAAPLFLSVAGLVLCYAYAWIHGVRQGEWGLAAMLVLASAVGRRTTTPTEIAIVHWWPLALLGGIQAWRAVTTRSSARSFAAAVCVLAGASIGLKDTMFVAYNGAAPLHLAFAAALVVGFVFHDGFALVLRRICAVVLPLACLMALESAQFERLPATLRLGYLATLTVVTIGCWRLAGDRWFLLAGGVNAACTLLTGAWSLQGTWARSVGARGFAPLVWGAVTFSLGVLISARKAHSFRRLKTATLEPVAESDPGGGKG